MAFVLMYFVTGFIMTHYNWFSENKPEPLTETHQFSHDPAMELTEISILIQKEYQLRGYREKPWVQKDSSIAFEYYHPGYSYEAVLSPNNELTIKKQEENFHTTMTVLHRIHGYGGGWIYSIYVFMMDLASLSMIIFAVTGIYLWLQMLKYRWLGWVVLILSSAYVFGVVFMLMR